MGSFKREERKQIMLETIVKRDGRIVPFELSKIADAVFKAAQATGGRDYDTAMSVAKEVERYLEEYEQEHGEIPVEDGNKTAR